MEIFDIWIIIFLSLFFLRGWHNGVMRSLSGPFSLFIWSIIAIICYDDNQNIILSISIWLTGTVFTTLFINILWFLGKRGVPSEHKNYVFWGSRLIGGLLSVAWKGSILAAAILILAALPTNKSWIGSLQKSTRASTSYDIIQSKILTYVPSINKISTTITVLSDPGRLKQSVSEAQYSRIINNPKVKRVLTSADLHKKMNDGDLLSLVNDEKIKDLINDKTLSKELSKIATDVYAKEGE